MRREHFDQQLREIGQEVLSLGSMVEKAIERAIGSLIRQDMEEARKIIDDDRLINSKRFEITERCIQLIATQQPMAVDLRFLIAMINAIVDLERIGDYAEGIAKINLMIGKRPITKLLTDLDILGMTKKAKDMLHQSLSCLLNRDICDVFRICAGDDEVDALCQRAFHELMLFMKGNPGNVEVGTYLIWVVHNLERIADRATNIAEQAYFLVTGRLEEKLERLAIPPDLL